jgi:hypothetical protein
MNKRTVLLVGVALALGAAYLYFFIDWPKGKEIHIVWSRPIPSTRSGSASPAIIFHLDQPYLLTSVKVVATEDAVTNKYPHVLWHLVATDAPVRTTLFRYGVQIKGMKPDIASGPPEPLEPDTSYTLLVEAGKSLKGKCTFQAQ